MRNASARARAPQIGIIGFGAFGQLMARELRPHFPLLAHDPVPDRAAAARYGVTLVGLERMARCPVVVLAVPVAQLADSIAAVAPHLAPGALVLDVGSVKSGPAELLRRGLPDHVQIVATHPLFGPQSAARGVAGLKIALCPIRGAGAGRLAAFLRARLGLRVVMTTPEAHDREAAVVQGLTHLIAKVLVRMGPLPTQMTTTSFELLSRAVEMVRDDAPEVFAAIEGANPFAPEVRRKFFALAAALEVELDDRLQGGSAEGPLTPSLPPR